MPAKFLSVFLSIIIVFSVTGCKNESDKRHSTIGAKENLLTVDVTIPASFFDEDDSEETILSAAKEQGFTKCVIHEDGSVTYTMTKSKHKEILSDLNANIEESLYNMVNGESSVPSFKRIEHSDDYSLFDVYVDAERVGLFDSLYVITFYLSGAYYQAFSGNDINEIDVKVYMIDDKTGETIESYSYQNWISKNKQ